MRAALSELATVRGEVVTALAVAAIVAIVVDDGAAVALGIVAIVTATVAVLAFSAGTRPRERNERSLEPGVSATDEVERQRILIARARLQELASQLDLQSPPPIETPTSPIDSRPLVSVVVPCFNDERFVSEALDSLRQQSYPNWECVVVDDASTDASWEVIRENTDGDDRFRTFRFESNSGSGAARNRGIHEAEGQLLAFLDADDLLLRESLTDRVEALQRHRDDPSVAGSFSAVRSSPEDVTLSSLPDRRHATQPPFVDFVIANGECPFTLHAPLVEISRIRSMGGFDETMTTGAVDWDLWYRMLRNGHVFVPSRTLGAVYRQKEGGITRGNKAGHTAAGAALIRAAFAPVQPGVIVAPTAFPMPEPLGSYLATLVVADRAVRFAAMALAEGDLGGMHKTLDVLDTGTWPLLERHLDWHSIVGRGAARVLGLRPKDVGEIEDVLTPLIGAVIAATAEATS